MNKILIVVMFLCFAWISSKAQSKPGPQSIGAPQWQCLWGSCFDDCTESFSLYQYGIEINGNSYFDNGSGYNTGYFDGFLGVGSYTVYERFRQINYNQFNCSWDGLTPGYIGSRSGVQYTLNVIADLAVTSSVTQSVCQGGSVNLCSYVNYCSGTLFYVDNVYMGSGVSTFNASSYSVGAHTIKAQKIFSNGVTEVTLGTITVLQSAGVTSHPANNSVCRTGSVSFSASGIGSGISYQWQFWNGSAWQNLTNGNWPGYTTALSGVTSGTLTFTNVHEDFNGWQVRMAVIGSCNTVYTNATGALAVYGQVGINSSPPGATNLCPGGALNLSANATPRNGGISYTWQYKYPTDGGYTDWVAGASLSTSAPNNQAWQGLQVRYKASDGCGTVNENFSSATTINIFDPLVVTLNPTSQSACIGGAVSFIVASAAQTGSLTYQWQDSNDNGATWGNICGAGGSCSSGPTSYSGILTNTLSISGVTSAINGKRVRCIMTDGCGSATQVVTNSATLTVYGNVSITSNPTNATICPGSNAVYSVTGSGPNGSLTYQWQESNNSGTSYNNLANSAVVTGVTTSTLTLVGVTSTWSGTISNLRYRCVVSDACGSVSSANSTGATLSLFSPVPISAQPVDRTICPGGNTTFTVTGTAQSGILSYLWEVSTNGGSVWGAVSNAGIYTGATTNTLSLTGATSSFSGYKYRVRVTDGCGSVNSTLSNVVTLTTYGVVSVTAQPPNRTICPNTNTTFTVTGTATNGSLTYQWQESTNGGTSYINITNTGIYSGSTTATLTLTSAPNTLNNARYRVVVADGCGAVNQTTSNAGVLTFNTVASISTQPPNRTGCVAGDVNFTIGAAGTGLSYQWQESINGGSTYTNLTNTGIYSGTTTATLTLTGLTAAYDTRRYRVIVTGTCNSVTSNGGILTVIIPPSISVDPVPSTACENTAASFSVTASGTGLTYQWQYSATGTAGTFTDVSSATAATYSITSAALSQNGYYRVMVNNGCSGGGSVSANARLTVNPLTTISSAPSNKAICPAGSTTFSTTVAGTGTVSYQWQLSTNNGSSFADISNTAIYSGATTNTLTLTGVDAFFSGYQYRIKATAGCGSSVNSSAATLTVNPTPGAPTAADVARCGDGIISQTATTTASSPTFKWYSNNADVIPVFTGSTYQITNLTVTTSMYVSVTSLTCESLKTQVKFVRNVLQDVPLGNPLNLCVGQGIYNLENDISDPIAKGSNFTWTANGTNFTSKNFDPSVGAGNYVVSYDPPSTAKQTPYCYVATTRNISIQTSAGEGGINFTNNLVSNGNTVNACVGDSPIDIATFPTVPGGSWSTVSGTGLSFSGQGVVFTPNSNSYTAVNPNSFRYTVTVNGCTASRDLNIYVKDNSQKPIITGIPSTVCPGAKLTMSAAVATPGTYSYEWTKPGQSTPFATGTSVDYTVTNSEVLQVRSVNNPFGCRSEVTLTNINTPFSSGQINPDKALVGVGEMVKFSYDVTAQGNSYQWTFGDGGTSIEKDPNHYYYLPGNFTVALMVTSNLGCTQTLSYNKITVTGEPIELITNIDTKHGESLTAFPNPASTDIFIRSGEVINSYALVDMRGNEIIGIKNYGLATADVDVRTLANGIYVLVVITKSNTSRIKVIKN